MLHFEEENKLSALSGAINGLAIQPKNGFLPASSAAQEPAAAQEGFRRVKVDDKRIIISKTDVNQLVPFKYKWAWEKYISACANHWMHQEISMQRDIEQWKDPNGFTDDERRIIKRNLGFFYLKSLFALSVTNFSNSAFFLSRSALLILLSIAIFFL